MTTSRIDQILALIGRMIMAWNEAESVWFLIYTCLVHQLPRPTAEAIIKRQPTGNSQRDLILTIAAQALKQYPEILTFLNSARLETDNLAIERNDIIHGDYSYAFERPDLGVRIGPGGYRTKYRNLFAGKALETELPLLIADIERLIKQLDQARHHLIWAIAPENQRPHGLSKTMPAEIRASILQTHPELEPSKTPLKWTPIRPTARQRN
jgi:hypothetical protein